MEQRHPASFPSSLRIPLAVLAVFLPLLAGCGSASTKHESPIVFYPPAPDPPRVQFLRYVSLGTDIEPGRSALDALLFGDQSVKKGFMAPYGAVVHGGLVYVCDIQQGAVLTLDFKAHKMDFLRLDGRAVLQKPSNLAFAADGKLYIADLGRRQIVVLSPNFEYVDEFGPWGDDSRPVDVDVMGDRLYVVDAGQRKVRVLDRKSGEEILDFGNDPGADHRHTAPTNIAVDDDGTCYVVDSVSCQVFVWSPEGKFLRFIGGPGDVVGQFARPKGIALLDDDLFVVDAAFENCQILDKNSGEPKMFFGGPGVEPGNLYLPAGIIVTEEGLDLFGDEYAPGFHPERLIIVTNLYGPYKVNFYAYGKAEGFDYSGETSATESSKAEASPTKQTSADPSPAPAAAPEPR